MPQMKFPFLLAKAGEPADSGNKSAYFAIDDGAESFSFFLWFENAVQELSHYRMNVYRLEYTWNATMNYHQLSGSAFVIPEEL